MKGPKPPVRVGEILKSNNNGEYEVIEYHHSKRVVVCFSDGTVVETNCAQIKRGTVRNPNKPSVFGVGFIGQGLYESGTTGKIYRNYNIWSAMLSRCYDPKKHILYPSYTNCTVLPEWHNFQNFAKWFEENYVDGWDLDKDILIPGNRIYGPDTCCFVPRELNNNFRRERTDRESKGVVHKDLQNRIRVALEKYSSLLDKRVTKILMERFEITPRVSDG